MIPRIATWLVLLVSLAAHSAAEDENSWGFTQDVNEQLYTEQCASCHGDRLEGGALGATLIKAPLQHGNALGDIIESIAEGYPDKGMPAWKDVLTESQIQRLGMLILELQAGFTYDSVDPMGTPLVVPETVQQSELYSFRLSTLTTDLQHPFAIAPLPDGRILYTEKSIGLSILSADRQSKTLVKGTPRVYDDNAFRGSALNGSGWIQEVALHPDYPDNGWIYLSYGDRCSQCNDLSKAQDKPVSMTALVRGRIENNTWGDEQVIWRGDVEHYLTGNDQAIGARIAFDDKGHVFLSVGAHGQEAGIQDLGKPYGKILRLLDNGRLPPDNPFVGTSGALGAIWSYGHRNPQGLAFDPVSGELWATEHGPRGGDELNLILPGNNYGWPMVSDGMWYDGTPINFAETLGLSYDPADLTGPTRQWTPSPAMSSMEFYRGKAFPDWTNNLFVCTLRQQRLLRLDIRDNLVVHEEVLLDGLGRFRDIEVAPNGNILLLIEQYYGSQIVEMSPAP